MKMKLWILTGALITVLAAPSAFARVRLGIAGAGDYGLNKVTGTEPTTGSSYEIKGGLGYGGGLLFEFGLGRHAFEVGGIFIAAKAVTTSTLLGVSSETTSTSNQVYIPGVFRLNLGRIVGVNLGGYYALSLESGGETDYGVAGGLRFNFGGSGFFFDSRYNYGLKDISGQKNQEVIGLLGMMFGKTK